MANVVNTNPMRLDTEGVVTTREIWITGIKWYPSASAGAIGNIIELKDAAGAVKWRHVVGELGTANNLETPPVSDHFTSPVKSKGLTLSDLDDGELLVYHQATRRL